MTLKQYLEDKRAYIMESGLDWSQDKIDYYIRIYYKLYDKDGKLAGTRGKY